MSASAYCPGPRPRTSVVIPAKDRVDKLRRAITSALEQTDTDLEVLVVDDGSEEPLEPRLAPGLRDPRLRFERQENTGPARARNAGVRAARGTYVAFLDSDDTWEPTKVQAQVARFERRHELALTGTGVRFVRDDGSGPDEIRTVRSGTPRVWELLQLTTPAAMLRRSVFLDSGGFAEDLYFMEDKELFLRLGLRHPFETIPEPLTVVHKHAGQTTHQAWRDLRWVERYQRDVLTFARRTFPLLHPTEWRHLARKVSVLETDLADMFAEHGARGRSLGARALSTLLSPQEPDAWRRLVASLRTGGASCRPGSLA